MSCRVVSSPLAELLMACRGGGEESTEGYPRGHRTQETGVVLLIIEDDQPKALYSLIGSMFILLLNLSKKNPSFSSSLLH